DLNHRPQPRIYERIRSLFSAERVAEGGKITAAALCIISPPAGRPVALPQVHIWMCAVVADLILAKEAGVAGVRLSLNRFPIVVRIIVKHDAPRAASLKDD